MEIGYLTSILKQHTAEVMNMSLQDQNNLNPPTSQLDPNKPNHASIGRFYDLENEYEITTSKTAKVSVIGKFTDRPIPYI